MLVKWEYGNSCLLGTAGVTLECDLEEIVVRWSVPKLSPILKVLEIRYLDIKMVDKNMDPIHIMMVDQEGTEWIEDGLDKIQQAHFVNLPLPRCSCQYLTLVVCLKPTPCLILLSSLAAYICMTGPICHVMSVFCWRQILCLQLTTRLTRSTIIKTR